MVRSRNACCHAASLYCAAHRYPKAAKELAAWYKLAIHAQWKTYVELRESFSDADAVDGYVVFNIRSNRYRLITIPHYARIKEGRLTQGHLYIRSFLTHKEYDDRAKWDKGF